VTEEDSFNQRLAAIARALLHEPDVQATLQRTVDDAARTLDGEVFASVSLVLQRRQVETVSATPARGGAGTPAPTGGTGSRPGTARGPRELGDDRNRPALR
jgi:hypothetical protein